MHARTPHTRVAYENTSPKHRKVVVWLHPAVVQAFLLPPNGINPLVFTTRLLSCMPFCTKLPTMHMGVTSWSYCLMLNPLYVKQPHNVGSCSAHAITCSPIVLLSR
jgi:hypothetical protein